MIIKYRCVSEHLKMIMYCIKTHSMYLKKRELTGTVVNQKKIQFMPKRLPTPGLQWRNDITVIRLKKNHMGWKKKKCVSITILQDKRPIYISHIPYKYTLPLYEELKSAES